MRPLDSSRSNVGRGSCQRPYAECMARECKGCSECVESWSEQVGYIAAAEMLPDDGLERVCAAGAPSSTPDYQSDSTSVEVKELVSGAVKGFQQAIATQPDVVPSPLLSRTWAVWPRIDWSPRFQGDKAPRIRGLVDRLAPLLAQLEKHDIFDYHCAPLELFLAIKQFVGGGACSALPPNAPFAPGVALGYAISGTRPANIDDAVVDVLQAWLDNKSAKMCQSLASGGPRQRCGVLVASDDGMQPVAARLNKSLNWDFPDERPTRALRLPIGIDVFLVVVGETVLKYDDSTWQRGVVGNYR